MDPTVAIGADLVSHLLALAEDCRKELDVLVYHNSAVNRFRRTQQTEFVPTLLFREMPLLVPWREAVPLRQHPDLQEVHFFVFGRVELTVADPRARAHDLNIARPDHRSSTEAVAVLHRPLEDVADDLHVAMAVLPKTPAW